MAITHAWHDIVLDMKDEVHDLATINKIDAARQAYLGLWATCIALPLLLGVDRLVEYTNTTWTGYLATWANDVLPGTASDAMVWIGVAEIVLAALVLLTPRIGGDLLALWMLVMAIDLFALDGMVGLGFAALAFGVCALAMARMSTGYHHKEV